MEFFFSTIGQYNPARHLPLPEHMIYPVAQRVPDGVDLDYSPLLIGQRFVMDSAVLQQIVESDAPHLAPMAYTLSKLAQEDLLSVSDMSGLIEKNGAAVLAKVSTLCQDPTVWLPIIGEQWRMIRPEFEEFQNEFGSTEMRAINIGHPGVENWLAGIGQYDNDDLRERLLRVLEGQSPESVGVVQEDVAGMLRFVLAQMVSTDLVRYSLGVPFVDWMDSRPLYDILYETRWDDAHAEFELQRQIRLLFDIVIPELRPGNVDQVIRFVRDNRAVRSMRAELLEQLDTGEDISERWLIRYLNEAVKSDLVTRGKIRKFRWLGAAAGAVMPGGGLIGLAAETALAGAESGVEKAYRGRNKRMYWYYALQESMLRGDRQP
jgi:hypothetical protein